jgi:hypothetical protein
MGASVAVVAAVTLPAGAPAQTTCPSGQTGTPPYCQPVVKVNVAGFTASTKPKRDRRAPYSYSSSGRLTVPTSVGNQGCTGKVAVRFKYKTKTLSLRRALLKLSTATGRCTWKTTVRFLKGRLLKTAGSGKKLGTLPIRLKVSYSFEGNIFLKPKTAPSKTVIAG